MTSTHILALDQGTTSSRAIVFDRQGTVVAMAQEAIRQYYPQSGWVEHDPDNIWQTQRRVAIDAVHGAGLKGRDIAAIGITNQRETTLLWEAETGRPIYPAIVWQDRRTAPHCAQLKERGMEERFRSKTGLLLDPYFSGTKIAWILDNVAGARPLAERGALRFGTIDTWLLWQLTGGKTHLTDVTNASRTLLMNLSAGQWDTELLDVLDIPRGILPEIRASSTLLGTVHGIPELDGVPIASIAGDQHAALFGQGCFDPGMAKNTYGTGCFLLMNTGRQPVHSSNNLLSTVAWKLGDQPTEFALEGSVFVAGALIQWLRDEMGLIASAQECDELAATVSDSGGLFIVPAFTGLGAPHWDPQARGIAIGISRGTNRAHFCRAALEAIAYQSTDLIRAMERDCGFSLRELRVDGGASRSDLLMQIQTDLLGTPVVRPQCVETTALGAAYLAGLAVGLWADKDEIRDNWRCGHRFPPRPSSANANAHYTRWLKAVDRSRNWLDS